MPVSTFINELDNKIKVKVTSGYDQSISKEEKKLYKGVLISISGPTSLSENYITLKEAEIIHEMLEEYLKTNKK